MKEIVLQFASYWIKGEIVIQIVVPFLNLQNKQTANNKVIKLFSEPHFFIMEHLYLQSIKNFMQIAPGMRVAAWLLKNEAVSVVQFNRENKSSTSFIPLFN